MPNGGMGGGKMESKIPMEETRPGRELKATLKL